MKPVLDPHDQDRASASRPEKHHFGAWGLVLTLFAALMIIGGAFFWRIAQAPLDLRVVKPAVEKALSYPAHGVKVRFGGLFLQWSPKERAIFLNVKNSRIIGPEGRTIMSVENMAMSASLRYLLLGRFLPRVIMVYDPHLELSRAADGEIDFGLGASTAASDTVTDDPVSADKAQADFMAQILAYIGQGPDGDAHKGSPLAALRRLEIRRARLNVKDEQRGFEWMIPRVDVVFQAYRRAGLQMDADVFFGLHGLDKDKAQLHLALPRGQRTMDVRLSLQDLSSRFLSDKLSGFDVLARQDVVLNGQADLSLSSDFGLEQADLNLSSAQGTLDVPIYEGKSLAYKDFAVQARYKPAEGVTLSQISAVVDGVSLSLSGALKPVQGAGEAPLYQGQVKLDVPRLVQDDFVRLWPESYEYVGAYEWLAQKISGGAFENLSANAAFSYNPQVQGEAAVTLDSAFVDFAFSGMSIDYRAPLTPVSDAQGRGHFDIASELLSVKVETAHVGAMQVSQGEAELSHFIESGHGHADVYLTFKGELRDVFAVLEDKPIAFKHGYDKARIKGQADLKVNVGVPTHGHVTMDDVKIDVRGSVSGGQLPAVFKGLDVSGATARIVVHDNAIDISGKGMIAAQAMDFDYRSFLDSTGQAFKEKVTVKGTVNESLRQRLGLDLSSFMGGALAADAVYTNYGGSKSQVHVRADLTPSLIFVEPLGYQKPSGQAAQADFILDLKNGRAHSLRDLRVSGPDLSIQQASLSFDPKTEALSGGEATRVDIGESSGRVDFSVDAAQRYRINAVMDRYDLRPLLRDDKPKDLDKTDHIALVASLKAKTLLTHEDQSVRDSQIYADIDKDGRFNQLEVDAKAGIGSIYLRYKPNDKGLRVFRFEADDAGATLAAFGLYQQIKGGRILVHAEPTAGLSEHNLVGVAEITNFSVVDAPTLAKLLSLMSLDGLTSGLGQEGIAFERLETKFDWLYRPQGSLLTLEEGRTSGSAIGLTFDGTIDQGQGAIDLSGTIVPVSEINGLIRSIPVLGDVLTGGSGVFAATYKVKGKTSEPEISINPLSVLAPGIIRRVLFE